MTRSCVAKNRAAQTPPGENHGGGERILAEVLPRLIFSPIRTPNAPVRNQSRSVWYGTVALGDLHHIETGMISIGGRVAPLPSSGFPVLPPRGLIAALIGARHIMKIDVLRSAAPALLRHAECSFLMRVSALSCCS